MHRISFFTLICLLSPLSLFAQQKTDLVKIDLIKKYPEKKIKLSEVADVSYVRFDATDDAFLFRGFPVLLTDNTIVIEDIGTGTFYLFSTDGTPKSTFNHRGNGPEEYTLSKGIMYDQKKDEFFITSHNKIQVYSSAGSYKRTILLPKDVAVFELLDLDEHSMILMDETFIQEKHRRKIEEIRQPGQADSSNDKPDNYGSSCVRISKKDGRLIEKIPLPEDSDILLGLAMPLGGQMSFLRAAPQHVVGYKEGYLLGYQENDTLFYYGKDHRLTPVWVQTPSIATMDPQRFMNPFVESAAYQFFEKRDVVMDRTRSRSPFPASYLMRDKETGAIYTQKLILDEYKNKEITITSFITHYSPGGKTAVIPLNLLELKDANREGKLSGKLKKLVASMDEDENEVYLLLKFR